MIFLQLVPVLPGALFQMSDRILKGFPFGFKGGGLGEFLLLADFQFVGELIAEALLKILELLFMIFFQLVPVLPGALFQMSDRILKGLPFGFKDLFPGESLLLSDLQFACQFLLKALPEILELFFMMLLQILKFGPMRLLDHLTFLKGLPFLRFQSGGGLGGGDPSGFRLRFQPVVFAETGAHGLKFHLFPGQTAPENEKTGGSAGKKTENAENKMHENPLDSESDWVQCLRSAAPVGGGAGRTPPLRSGIHQSSITVVLIPRL